MPPHSSVPLRAPYQATVRPARLSFHHSVARAAIPWTRATTVLTRPTLGREARSREPGLAVPGGLRHRGQLERPLRPPDAVVAVLVLPHVLDVEGGLVVGHLVERPVEVRLRHLVRDGYVRVVVEPQLLREHARPHPLLEEL